MPVNWCKHW